MRGDAVRLRGARAPSPSPPADDRFISSIAIVAVLGVVLIGIQRCFAGNFPFDFAYLHAAGRAWLAGVDPYGPGYASFAAPLIPAESALWAYPPQWWFITAPLSLLPVETAAGAWKIAGFAALMIGFLALAEVFDCLRDRGRRLLLLAIAALFALSDSTWITLTIGQTSTLMLLGIALMLLGFKHGRTWLVTAGMTILLLKPQFGLFFLLLLLSGRKGRRPALQALGLTALAGLPHLATFEIGETWTSALNYLANLSAYQDQPWNRPGSMSGLDYVLTLAGVPTPPVILYLVGAWLLSLVLTERAAVTDPVARCVIGLAVFYLIVPLHGYDLILAPALLLLTPHLAGWARGLMVFAVVLDCRASSLPYSMFGEQPSQLKPEVYLTALIQAGVGTIAMAMLFAAIVWGRRQTLHASGSWSDTAWK